MSKTIKVVYQGITWLTRLYKNKTREMSIKQSKIYQIMF